jgi:threonine aldolase
LVLQKKVLLPQFSSVRLGFQSKTKFMVTPMLTRRELMRAAGSASAIGIAGSAAGQSQSNTPLATPKETVRLTGDGIGLSPTEFTTLLNGLCHDKEIETDNYLIGGEVEEFEKYCANLLGKEMAVFMPSGTLANQLALRQLAGDKRRVIVPGLSHVYNDTGDASQNLSGLNLIPLAQDRATFTLEEVEAVIDRTAGGRVTAEVGAILIESPIRRLSGEMVDWEETKRIASFAREKGIGTHLDGARLFIASAYTGISPAEYAEPFDTVYFSLWKYFNSGIGAILAGPKADLENMFHVRRMFGGNLFAGWSAAVVARHYVEGYVDRLKDAVALSEEFYKTLDQHPSFEVTRITNGTNLARVTLTGTDSNAFRSRLADRDILIGRANEQGRFTLGVNETWNRTSAENLVRAFSEALS